MAVNREDYLSLLERSAQRVPYWARSTNPIVRRHLGLNWRTIPPEISLLLKGVGIWLVIMILSLFVPILQVAVGVIVIAAILVMPLVILRYIYVLLMIAITASDAMREEVQNDTLPLLRATPMDLNQIVLGKVAVALWKRMDDLELISLLAMVFTPPILLWGYATYWPTQENPVTGVFIVLFGLVVSVARLLIEPLFVGVIAVFVSVITPGRSAALTASISFGVFYFVMINLVSHLPGIRDVVVVGDTTIPPNLAALFTVDFILPLVVPIIAGFLLLRLTTRIIARD